MPSIHTFKKGTKCMKPYFFKTLATITLCCSLVVGCMTIGKLTSLSAGMTTSEVISVVGEPKIARMQVTNKYGQVIELWHYELYNNRSDSHEPYFLYFYDGKLVQWGKAADLPPDKICETEL
ncbi:MAG: hypothetical protein BA861_11125 [Desulfobacterales bacterium S3730MH5]|nr:MAG: hypothetical protein BA861_11125 [Desulfobacterales bacterium S3730MH5]